MAIQISFIVLSWNSEEFLGKCFASVMSKCEEEEISYEIIGIDNGSKDKSVHLISSYRERYPHQFKQITLSENRGTTYPRNLGLKEASGQYICILDSDTELREGSLSDVLNVLSDRKEIGLIAPQLFLADGAIQNSVKKFPVFWHKLGKIPKALFNMKVHNYDFYEDFPFISDVYVDTAISACWIFRKEIIAEVGYLDEKIFYAPEDVDFCLRIWLKGFKILYYPEFKVLHNTQQISHRQPLSRVSISHFWGLLYYFSKHGGWFSMKTIYRHINCDRTNK